MPTIYLSPSLQEFNEYVNGGSEEYYMNLLADEMEPYLVASGIKFVRNNPSQSLSSAIRDSNAGNYDVHLALHSNAAPPQLAGKIKGTDIYYYPQSANSKRLADITAENFKEIYPNPSIVKTVPTTRLAEVAKTKAPAILIEVAYHDNEEDANWIRNNLNEIARNLVMSLTEYFDIPFVEPGNQRNATVTTMGGNLNIRSKPSTESSVIASAPNGSAIKILGQWQNWYVVDYNGTVGYASSKYIS